MKLFFGSDEPGNVTSEYGIYPVFTVDKYVPAVVSLAHFKAAEIILQQCFQRAVRVVKPVLNCAGIFFYIGKMPGYIVAAHHKANETYLLKVIGEKVLFPVKGDNTPSIMRF